MATSGCADALPLSLPLKGPQSGNTGADRKTGQPIIFDAASYYGHNEAEWVMLSPFICIHSREPRSLGIARMFGGIPRAFFTEYHAHMPKTAPEEQYKLRADLYELFHYLNHTVLFGVRPASGQDVLLLTGRSRAGTRALQRPRSTRC
jgi:fructosamine-3-kinase